MKKFVDIMVIVYIFLFIPVTFMAAEFGAISETGIENVNFYVASAVKFLVNLLPVVVFASAGFGYALGKNEYYKVAFYILWAPIVVFILVWLGVMFA